MFEMKEGKEGEEENVIITGFLDLSPLKVSMSSSPSPSSSFSFSASELRDRIDSLAVNLTPMEG